MVTLVHHAEKGEKASKGQKFLLKIAITATIFMVTESSERTEPEMLNGFEIKLVPGTENLVPSMKVISKIASIYAMNARVSPAMLGSFIET